MARSSFRFASFDGTISLGKQCAVEALEFELACELQVGSPLDTRSAWLSFLNEGAVLLDVMILDRSFEGVRYMSVLTPGVGWVNERHETRYLHPYLGGKRVLRP